MVRPHIAAIISMVLCGALYGGTNDEGVHKTESRLDAVELTGTGRYATVRLSDVRDNRAATRPTTKPTTLPVVLFDATIHSEKVEGIVDGENVALRLFGRYKFVVGPRFTTDRPQLHDHPAGSLAGAAGTASRMWWSVLELAGLLDHVPDALLGAESQKDPEIVAKARSLAGFLSDGPHTFTVKAEDAIFTATLTPTKEWKAVVSDQDPAIKK